MLSMEDWGRMNSMVFGGQASWVGIAVLPLPAELPILCEPLSSSAKWESAPCPSLGLMGESGETMFTSTEAQ